MECIIGADFLMQREEIASITRNSIIWKRDQMTHIIRIAEDDEINKLERVNIFTDAKAVNERKCKDCKGGRRTFKENHVKVFSHSIRQNFEDETLPHAADLFADSQELKEENLDKKITLADGDYSQCPENCKDSLMRLMEDFKDRFSFSKLDLEITDMYTADLETEEVKIVNQKCKRLPSDRFKAVEKAVKQLEQAGIASVSDAEWRSNLVLVPKPQNEDLSTKPESRSKAQRPDLFRICLDYKELNNVLVPSKQAKFMNLELSLIHI